MSAVTRSREALPADVDRLVTDESPFPVGERLVFLQVESPTPRSSTSRSAAARSPQPQPALARGRRYRVQAPKGTGSSDADFRALTGVVPSRDVPTYKIPGYPYDGSFVHRLHRRGYRSAAIHGVTGEFFNRRRAYEEMPWDDLLFREEFLGRGLVDTEAWAVDDARLLEGRRRPPRRLLGGPDFEPVITATSHIPFPLAPERRVFFPDDTRDRFAYFDSIHYVDAAIGEFMAALPPGTTVVLYGDHVSKMENPELGYRQQLLGEDGCVPFLILESGADLSPGQRVGPEGDACTLTSLHTFRYVHQVVLAADTGEVAAAGDAGGARAIEAPAPAAPGARVTTSAGVGP
ncbi:MAG: sulfatase-like hydrolase/transferase [Nannocystaceae bacterium]